MIILLCGTQAIGQEISDSLRIHFQQSKSLFNESVAGNSQFYGSLADLLEMAKRKDVEIVSITVYGAASPEGGIGYNKGLSKRRADRIASYIAEVGGGRISPEVIAVGRDWKGLYALAVADSELPSREATLDLLCRLAMPNDKESEDRMFAQLKALDGGKPYRYMYNRLFPELRKAGVKVVAVYRIDDLVSDSRALLEATFVEPAEIRISTGVDVMPEAQKKPWYAGVKTNMLYDALLVPNGGLFSRRYAGDILSSEWRRGDCSRFRWEKRWLRRNSFRGLRCGVLQQRHAEGEIQRSRWFFVDSCNDRCRAGWRRQGFPHARLFVWRAYGCCGSGSKDWLRADNSASGGTYGVSLHIHGARREKSTKLFGVCGCPAGDVQRVFCWRRQ